MAHGWRRPVSGRLRPAFILARSIVFSLQAALRSPQLGNRNKAWSNKQGSPHVNDIDGQRQLLGRRTAPPTDESGRREASVILAIFFLVGVSCTVLMTLSGMHALVLLVTAADGLKSVLITGLLGLGLALLGPVLLLALAMILPRWWFQDVKRHMKKLWRRAIA